MQLEIPLEILLRPNRKFSSRSRKFQNSFYPLIYSVVKGPSIKLAVPVRSLMVVPKTGCQKILSFYDTQFISARGISLGVRLNKQQTINLSSESQRFLGTLSQRKKYKWAELLLSIRFGFCPSDTKTHQIPGGKRKNNPTCEWARNRYHNVEIDKPPERLLF